MDNGWLRWWTSLPRPVRIAAAMLVFWCAHVLVSYGLGRAELSLDGRRVPMASWDFVTQVVRTFGPFWLASTAALVMAPRWLDGGRIRWRAALGWTWVFASLFCCDFFWGGAPVDAALGYYVTALPGTMVQAGAFVATGLLLQFVQQAAARERTLQQAQLRALRAQLQPHFLFNTLHAIGVTATRDGALAARMTTLLGDMLRHTLRERHDPLVPLAEEQELLRPYLELQRLRFADRLRVQCDLDPGLLGAMVPDLLLQPLVENALQHGIEQRPGAGSVAVNARRVGDDLVLEVRDDGVPPAVGAEPRGMGLAATRERLRTLFGSRASLDLAPNPGGGTTATVRLPFREARDAA